MNALLVWLEAQYHLAVKLNVLVVHTTGGLSPFTLAKQAA